MGCGAGRADRGEAVVAQAPRLAGEPASVCIAPAAAPSRPSTAHTTKAVVVSRRSGNSTAQVEKGTLGWRCFLTWGVALGLRGRFPQQRGVGAV